MDLIYIIVHAVFWLLGFILLFRIPTCPKNAQPVKPPLKLSIIIPALNEEKNLAVLFDSIKKQSLVPYEIIVAVSPSKDRTLETAQNAGAKVILAGDIPAGWLGKSWACYLGAEASSGEILMFLDADVFFEGDGLQSVAGTFMQQNGVISVQPFHKTRKGYEQLSSFFNIITMAAMNIYTIFGSRSKPAGLFGPCIVISRKDYFDIGGHAAVKADLVEDLALGELLRRHQIPIRCLSGKNSLSYRMYPNGFGSLVEGWTKNIAAGPARISFLALLSIILWVGGCLGTIISLTQAAVTGNWLALIFSAALYLAFVMQIHWMLRRIGSFRPYTAIFYPIFLLFFICIFVRSFIWIFIKKKVKWKGRTIDLKDKAVSG